jgi:hypothetical protein
MLLDSFLLFIPILAANQAAQVIQMVGLSNSDVVISKRWLGEHKTLLPYVVAPLLVIWTMNLLYGGFYLFSGLVLGWGAVLGDHIKSLIKRRLGYPPGTQWWADRVDFAIGGGVMAWFFFPAVTVEHVLLMVAFAWPVHWVGNRIGYMLSLRKTPH